MLNTAQGDTIQCHQPAAFRDAMRRLAASVTLITARDVDHQPHGMVASSVISVSMEPASMLIAVNQSASLHQVLERTARFCINLLGEHQDHLLKPFSQSALRAERFKSADWADAWLPSSDRMPWLPDAAAAIHCKVDAMHAYGTHTLFIGRVLEVRCNAAAELDVAPMVWLAGRPAQLSRALAN